MRILIIEDNEKLAKSLKRGLEIEGIISDYLLDGESGLRRIEAANSTYDALILDIMLPEKDGLTICSELRAKKISIPILMLTAKDTIKDKITGLNVGADDYLVKPFSFEELLARLNALARRPKEKYTLDLKIRDIILNPISHRVMKNNKEIKLTQREFSILEYLMRHVGELISRQRLLDHAWDYDFTSFSNFIDVKVKNIRKKIGDNKGKIIETVRGVGYRMKE